MNNESTLKRKHTRNVRATRYISAVLCVEQAVYGFIYSENGSSLQTLYFRSSMVIGILFLLSWLIPFLLPIKPGILYDLFDMIPLATGLCIAYARMLYATHVSQNIPTVYLAVLFGGAVILPCLSQNKSLISTLSITVIFIIASYDRLPFEAFHSVPGRFLESMESLHGPSFSTTYANFLKT